MRERLPKVGVVVGESSQSPQNHANIRLDAGRLPVSVANSEQAESARDTEVRYRQTMEDLLERAYVGRTPEGHLIVDGSVLPNHGLGLMMPPRPWTPSFGEDELARRLSGPDARPAVTPAAVNKIRAAQTGLIEGSLHDEIRLDAMQGADDRRPLEWDLAWGSTSGWPRWVGSIGSGTGGLVSPRVFMTNAHVVDGIPSKDLSVELGEHVWLKTPAPNQPHGVGALTRLLHPPIPVVEVVRGTWTSGQHHLDVAFAILEYEPTIAQMLSGAAIPTVYGGYAPWWLDASKFQSYVASIDQQMPWGSFGLTGYTTAMCGTKGALLGGRVWNPNAAQELQPNGMLGDPDYQTWQTMLIGAPLLSQDGGLLVEHWADTVGGMSGSPVVKWIDNQYFAVGVHVGGIKDKHNFFCSGPIMTFNGMFAAFLAEFLF